MPSNQSDKSLSKQLRRSRYESILALIKFCEENNDTYKTLKKKAFKRALSRAHNYNRMLKQTIYLYSFYQIFNFKVIFS